MDKIAWNNQAGFTGQEFICGYCGRNVGSERGYTGAVNDPKKGNRSVFVLICPSCTRPSFLDDSYQMPGAPFGNDVGHLPDDIHKLYSEARSCMTVSAYTASVLACRKLLMHIAVSKGAKAGDTFLAYVDFLASTGYLPPGGKGWVDHIRDKSNEANHDILIMERSDAERLLSFVEMLLKFIFEFPGRVVSAKASPRP